MRIGVQNLITKPCRINGVSIELIQNCINICNYIFPCTYTIISKLVSWPEITFSHCIECLRSSERYEMHKQVTFLCYSVSKLGTKFM